MSYEEEDTCVSYEEEDTCVSYEEEDACTTCNALVHVPRMKQLLERTFEVDLSLVQGRLNG
jgi:hypothetical protein